VVVFVLIAYASMWLATVPFWVSPRGLALPGAAVVIAAAMFGPALASAVVCRYVDRRPWRRTVGLGPVRPAAHPVRRTLLMLVLAFLAVVACTVVGTALAAALGLVRLDLVGLSGLPATPLALPRPALLLVVLAQVVVAAFTINAFVALGEEVGWRGYLLPALLPLGRVPAVLITGLVWAGWHTPLILLGYEFTGTPRPLAMIVFAAFCVTSGAVLAWFRLRTDSVLPGAVAHGAIDAVAGVPLLLVAAGHPQHPLLLAPAGLLGSLAFGLLAIGLAVGVRRGAARRRPGG
jgi:membrane protease YdiL (CAAX protease family)